MRCYVALISNLNSEHPKALTLVGFDTFRPKINETGDRTHISKRVSECVQNAKENQFQAKLENDYPIFCHGIPRLSSLPTSAKPEAMGRTWNTSSSSEDFSLGHLFDFLKS